MSNLPANIPNPTLLILDLVLKGEHITATAIAEVTGLPKLQVMRVMGDPAFVLHYDKLTKESARTEFNSVKYKTLMEIIQNATTNKEKIEALRTMEEFLNTGTANKSDVGSTLEGIIKGMNADEELRVGIQKRKFKGLD